MADLNETHDPTRRSWVEAANAPDCDFPIQNLPFGVFQSPGRAPRGGVAIGDMIFDLKVALDAELFSPSAREAARAACEPTLNALMALPPRQISALRRDLSQVLRSDGPNRQRVEKMAGELLVPMQQASYLRPVVIGDFTDFFTSVDHVSRVGRIVRPDSDLPPAFKHLPLAYNGRTSSIVISDTPVIRPRGQKKLGNGGVEFAPTRSLDYELEAGIFIGAGNALGQPIPLRAAPEHIFGLCLLNDWSARDIQRWESFPLGPFLGKSFCTTISPWIVTSEALAPFRVPAVARAKDDPAPQAYLQDAGDQANGAFDIELSTTIQTAAMRSKGQAPARITRTNLKTLYWTAAQMIAHHTSNGCNLQPGDLLGTGTTSGPTDESRACMLELTAGGKQPLKLPDGETRSWLEDGDEIAFHGRAHRDGFVPIGFGSCRARIAPALNP
jgi:fumarylacetoacetase